MNVLSKSISGRMSSGSKYFFGKLVEKLYTNNNNAVIPITGVINASCPYIVRPLSIAKEINNGHKADDIEKIKNVIVVRSNLFSMGIIPIVAFNINIDRLNITVLYNKIAGTNKLHRLIVIQMNHTNYFVHQSPMDGV